MVLQDRLETAKWTVIAEAVYVMVNVRAYPRSFSIPDEGGARVWYVKTTEGISCTRRDAVRSTT